MGLSCCLPFADFLELDDAGDCDIAGALRAVGVRGVVAMLGLVMAPVVSLLRRIVKDEHRWVRKVREKQREVNNRI